MKQPDDAFNFNQTPTVRLTLQVTTSLLNVASREPLPYPPVLAFESPSDSETLLQKDIRRIVTLEKYKMPKAVKGALLQCDPPQMAMVRKLDRESDNAYIIEEIDDRTCLVKESSVEELKRLVKEVMDAAMGVDDDDDDDKDSDLD